MVLGLDMSPYSNDADEPFEVLAWWHDPRRPESAKPGVPGHLRCDPHGTTTLELYGDLGDEHPTGFLPCLFGQMLSSGYGTVLTAERLLCTLSSPCASGVPGRGFTRFVCERVAVGGHRPLSEELIRSISINLNGVSSWLINGGLPGVAPKRCEPKQERATAGELRANLATARASGATFELASGWQVDERFSFELRRSSYFTCAITFNEPTSLDHALASVRSIRTLLSALSGPCRAISLASCKVVPHKSADDEQASRPMRLYVNWGKMARLDYDGPNQDVLPFREVRDHLGGVIER